MTPCRHGTAALGAAVWLVAACGGSPGGDAAPESAVPVVVQPVAVLDQPETTTANGIVEGTQTVDLAFQVGGRVARVAPEEGERVAAGAVLARLDTTEFQLGLDLAAAAAARARDEWERTRQLSSRGSAAAVDLTRAETAHQQAEAQRALAAKRLADAILTTPIAGVVARRGLDPGEMAAPGVPVFTVIAIDPIQVRAGIPEADIGGIRTGQSATVTVPSAGSRVFEGLVGLVGVAADPVSRTYAITIRIPNSGRTLRPGMIAEVRISTDRRVEALTVPGEAIVRQADGSTIVFVLRAGETRVAARRVVVGRVLEQAVEITDGVAAGDRVVVGGQHRLADGVLVAVQVAPAGGAGL